MRAFWGQVLAATMPVSRRRRRGAMRPVRRLRCPATTVPDRAACKKHGLLRRARRSRRERRRNEALRARLDRGLDQIAVVFGIQIDDIDARRCA